MITPQTLKGFRDFLPKDALKRQYVIDKIRRVFERYGFDPLETPALEYAETLLGKYGDEADKLLYLFEDNGGRSVGLRYDQTVPLARVIAQYQNDLPFPFKRYQIQPVWRAENTQKGRFREFLQCDIDTVGTVSALADAEIIACSLTAFGQLGFTDTMVLVNDRTLFDNLNLTKKEIIIIDKLEKIGRGEVIRQLSAAGRDKADDILTKLGESKPTEKLSQIFSTLESYGFTQGKDVQFSPFLARGLDYYTSSIFEVKIPAYSAGSLAGGGRYDKLIGTFIGSDVPAVGIAFGFDRIVEALNELSLLPESSTTTQILLTVFDPTFTKNSAVTTAVLRNAGVNAETYPEPVKLDKQLKYADRKGIPYVVIQGPDEAQRGVVKLKDMNAKTQEELTVAA
ncbi:MAG: histidine--tRNA ligase [Patescibacteria group bacterium]